jgi:hypothetical protein
VVVKFVALSIFVMELSSWEEWVDMVGRIGGVETIEGLIQRSKLWM